MTQQKPPEEGLTLKQRIRMQQEQPGHPTSATPTSVVPQEQQPIIEPKAQQKQEIPTTKATVRASHFVDEQGIAWTRTGLTLPTAFWKGIFSYVNQAKLAWEPGQEKLTQQQIIVEAIGIWLNDHRADLPGSVNTECDRVREKLR